MPSSSVLGESFASEEYRAFDPQEVPHGRCFHMIQKNQTCDVLVSTAQAIRP